MIFSKFQISENSDVSPRDFRPISGQFAAVGHGDTRAPGMVTHACHFSAVSVGGIFDAILATSSPILEISRDFAFSCEKLIGSGVLLIDSYHPSQRNTFTGRLTEEAFDRVFFRAREALKE